jgi:hypothetical protein
MRAMRRTLLAAPLFLAACTSSSPQGSTTSHASGDGSGSGLICHEEQPTGSSISRKICRTPEQIEDDRKEADQMLNTPATRSGPRVQ